MKEKIRKNDRSSSCSQCVEKSFLIAEVAKDMGWSKLWDTFGEKYTTGLQKLSQVISHHGRGQYPWPLCENSEFRTTVLNRTCFVLVSCSRWRYRHSFVEFHRKPHTIDVLPYACDTNIINTVRRFMHLSIVCPTPPLPGKGGADQQIKCPNPGANFHSKSLPLPLG